MSSTSHHHHHHHHPSENEKIAWALMHERTGIVRHRLLGQGSFAQVWQVSSTLPASSSSSSSSSSWGQKREWACKVIAVQKANPAELCAGALLSHPNVVTMHDMHEFGHYFFVRYELIHGCDLQQWISNHHIGPVPESIVHPLMMGILRGLHYCHRMGLAHRDLKLENVMVRCVAGGGSGGFDLTCPVIVDFGMAFFFDDPVYPPSLGPVENKCLHWRRAKGDVSDWKWPLTARSKLEDRNRYVGTKDYLAPEILLYGEELVPADLVSIDLYAVGVIFYVLLCDRFPFPGINDQLRWLQSMHELVKLQQRKRPRETLRQLSISHESAVYERMQQAWYSAQMHALSPELASLVRGLTDPIPANRLGWSDIYAHDWILSTFSCVAPHAHHHNPAPIDACEPPL